MVEARQLGYPGEKPRTVLPIAAVTGLAAEARIARRLGLRAEAAGGDAEATRAAIARLIAGGARALLSFGICGGLDPALASGTLLVPQAVVSEAGARYAVDDALHRALAAALAGAGLAAVMTGEMLGASAPAATLQRKAALFRQFGARAVDLESHHVAGAAVASGLPFIVLRAVADGARRSVPQAAMVGLDREGRAAPGPVLLSLARDPRQVPELLRLALDTGRALAALRRASRVAAFVLLRPEWGGKMPADTVGGR